MKVDRLAVTRTQKGCVTPGLFGWRVFKHNWFTMETEEMAYFMYSGCLDDGWESLKAANKFLLNNV
jgi:hypothetical protein